MLCLYLRIFSTRPYRYSIYVIASMVVGNCMTGLILCLTICHPVTNGAKERQRCLDTIITTYRYYMVPIIFTDVCILVLPLHGVWHLHMKIVHKIGLTITFLLGCA